MPNLFAMTATINHTSQLYGIFSTTFEVVALGSDKYVLTYGAGNDWDYTAGSGSDIRAEIWNTNGTLAVSHFFIPTIRGGDQQDLSVVETPGGGFTAAWSARLIQTNGAYNFGNLGPQDSIRMARFGVDGARIGVEVAFEPGGTLPNWNGVAIAYSDNVNTSFPLIAASAFGSALSPNSTEMIIMSEMAPHFVGYGAERAGAQTSYQLTERSGPALTISWTESVGGQAFIKGGIINGINQPIYGEWLVPLTTGVGVQDRGYEVTVLATGETVVGYDDVFGGGLVKYRIFNPDGSGGGTPLYVSIDESAEAFTAMEDGIAVHALNDGGFVAAWWQGGYTAAGGAQVVTGLYMRAYDATGNATGAAVLVKQEVSSTSYVDIDIDVGDDGAIVIGWVEYSTNSGIGGTYSRVFREQVAVNGTLDADILSGTVQVQAFAGLAGFDMVSYAFASTAVSASLEIPSTNTGAAQNDTYSSIEALAGSAFGDLLTGDGNTNQLEGLGSADSLLGLGGNDVLFGGEGNDTLDGGEGDDNLQGSAGADSHVGGMGFDIVRYDDSWGVQVDILFSNAYGSFAAGDSFSGIEGVSGSNTDDGVWGTDENNTIFTWLGNDYIDGRGGVDVLLGGANNDTLVGGADADYLAGEAGADVFRYLALTDSGPGAQDYLPDFSSAQGDRIDVSALRGGTSATFNSGFGTGTSVYAFSQSGGAWTLVQMYQGTTLHLQLVVNVSSLSAGDFIL